MKRFSSIIGWVKRGWSFHVVIFFIIVHLVLYFIFKDARNTINSLIILIAQASSVITVIIIINDNISQFRGLNIINWWIKYFNSFPSKKQARTMNLEEGLYGMSGSQIHAYVEGTWDNPEEGLKELERRIHDLRVQMDEKIKSLEKKMNAKVDKLETSIKKLNQDIVEARNLLDTSVMGEIQPQTFAFLMILYSFICEVILFFSS